MMDPDARVAYWAAQECTWQRSGAMSVAWMLDAWAYAMEHQYDDITDDDVLKLGALVEPDFNRNGIRMVGVRVGWSVKLSPELVPAALKSWITEILDDMEPAEAFRQYEEIHPFVDGNGRSGSIIFNWLNGTLSAPIHPPNLWDDPRRDVFGYPDPTQIILPIIMNDPGYR